MQPAVVPSPHNVTMSLLRHLANCLSCSGNESAEEDDLSNLEMRQIDITVSEGARRHRFLKVLEVSRHTPTHTLNSSNSIRHIVELQGSGVRVLTTG